MYVLVSVFQKLVVWYDLVKLIGCCRAGLIQLVVDKAKTENSNFNSVTYKFSDS